MELAFLGGATTVTGSQFLLDTGEARVLVDCGMFQGSPNETVRNRLPFAFDPREIDALLLTHAHLDHCGLIPHLVASGFSGSIYAPAGTVELGGRGSPIIRDPTVLTDADYVLLESTYGGREHEPEAQASEVLAETVREVDRAGGVLLVPAFAIGRTQDVVWELDRLLVAGRV